MSTLFRQEALEGRQGQWLGHIQLLRPVSASVLTALVLAAVAAIAVFLHAGHYTRKARVAGVLVPEGGVMRLVPPQNGSVLEARVREGQVVRAGEVLFVLSVDRSTLGGETQAAVRQGLVARERSLKEAVREREQLLGEQRASLGRRIEDMRREAAQMEAEASLQRQRLALAQAAEQRLESLRADNFVSSAQVQAKSEDVLGLQAQLQALERQRAGQLREIGALEAQLRELPMRERMQQGAIERDLAALQQERAESEARGQVVVRAPQDGVVSGVLAAVGQSVSPGVALASLVPAGAPLQAQLFAPSSAVGFLHERQTVQLRYQAYPYQKFGHHTGQVLQVSRTPLQPSELAALPLPGAVNGSALGAATEPLYRITVALDAQSVQAYGTAQSLAAGMQLDADVLLDRRRLVEWMFEPLLGIAGRV